MPAYFPSRCNTYHKGCAPAVGSGQQSGARQRDQGADGDAGVEHGGRQGSLLGRNPPLEWWWNRVCVGFGWQGEKSGVEGGGGLVRRESIREIT